MTEHSGTPKDIPERFRLTESEQLGCNAADVSLLLNVEIDNWQPDWPTENREWIPSDEGSLRQMADFEVFVAGFSIEPRVSTEHRGEVQNAISVSLATYHEALPFSEAERHWLSAALRAAPKDHPGSIESIRDREERILSSGVWQIVKGGDLMRRWWSWRRQTDEFEGQRSFAVARDALDDIASLLRQ